LHVSDPNRRLYESAEATLLYSALRDLTACEAMLFKKYVQPGMRILDVGVGAGRTTEFLAEASSFYVGLDYSMDLLLAARKRFHDSIFVLGDAAEISMFPDSFFDLIVFSFNGLDHLQTDSSRIGCLKKCADLLRTGGRFILSRHNARYLFQRWRDLVELSDPGRLGAILHGGGYVELKNHRGLRNHFVSRTRARMEFEQTGFEVVEVAGSVYPQKRSSLSTPWYYYVLQKNAP
jgi:SAM-dependent methyltransferase